MMESQLCVGFLATARTLTAGLADALDVNDNGQLGWPDLLAWLFFSTVGLLGVAVVAGMAFGGVAVTVHGIRRITGTMWASVRHRDKSETGQSRRTFGSGRTGARDEHIASTSTSGPRHQAGTSGPR